MKTTFSRKELEQEYNKIIPYLQLRRLLTFCIVIVCTCLISITSDCFGNLQKKLFFKRYVDFPHNDSERKNDLKYITKESCHSDKNVYFENF